MKVSNWKLGPLFAFALIFFGVCVGEANSQEAIPPGQIVYSKTPSQSLLNAAAGSKIGDVYLNAPLTVVEAKGDWIKVNVSGWVAKDGVAAKVGSSATAALIAGSTALKIADFSTQKITSTEKGVPNRIYLKLSVENISANVVKSWKSFLMAKNKAGQRLFTTTVTDESANIAPSGKKEVSFVYESGEEPYDVLLGADKNAIDLVFEQLKIE